MSERDAAARPAPPDFDHVRVEAADGCAFLRIDRPEKRNALDDATRAELCAALDWAVAAEPVRVVVLSGTGEKAFASGADLSDAAGRSLPELRATLEGRRVQDALAECPKPVVAMIQGHCLGGGLELALAADIRIASQRARLGLPEINLALIPGGGGTQRLARLVGMGQALRLILTGQPIGAEEALRLGLVELVVPPADLLARTRELCAVLARHSPLALALAKRAVRAGAELPLEEGLAQERELFYRAFESEDRVEGVNAFLEKRPPHFRGR